MHRYGVGAKNAVFKLGEKVTVSSKTAGCDWVNELTLDKVLKTNKHPYIYIVNCMCFYVSILYENGYMSNS